MKIRFPHFIACLFILISGFTACDQEYLGETVIETRALPDFSKLQVNTVGKISLFAAPEFKVVVNTHAALQDDIWTKVVSDELQITLTGRHRKIKKIEIEVYAPTFERITLDNVADISCTTGFTASTLEIRHRDVGGIDLRDIATDSLYVDLDDVGDVRLSGNTVFEKMSLRGVGSIRAYDLRAQHCEARLTGVGDIEVFVSETLSIHHDGVGKVKYKGYPDINVSGDLNGKIENRN
jgi:hypothetical protein